MFTPSVPAAVRRAPLALLSLAAVASAQTTWTVDAGGGGDFTSLQAAIDAAAPGDVLHVLPGQYGGCVLSKTLALLGDTSSGAPQPVVEALDVQGAPSFVASNLALPRLRVAGVPGRSLVERCSLGGGAPWNAPYFGWSAVLIDGAGDLHVQRSTVLAGHNGAGDSGYTALVARGSDVVVASSSITGGSAPAGNGKAGRGGDAVHLWGGSRAWIAASDVVGGAGDDFQPAVGAALPGTGGVGLRIGEPSAAAWADVRGSLQHELRGGLQDGATSGPHDGYALRVMHACAGGPKSMLGAVTTVGAVDACADATPGLPFAAVEGPVGPGQVASFALYGTAGAPAVLVLALGAGELALPAIATTPLWLDPAAVLLLHPAVMQGPTAPAALPLPQPTGTALAGLAVHAQAFEITPAGALVGTNASALVLGY